MHIPVNLPTVPKVPSPRLAAMGGCVPRTAGCGGHLTQDRLAARPREGSPGGRSLHWAAGLEGCNAIFQHPRSPAGLGDTQRERTFQLHGDFNNNTQKVSRWNKSNGLVVKLSQSSETCGLAGPQNLPGGPSGQHSGHRQGGVGCCHGQATQQCVCVCSYSHAAAPSSSTRP